MTGLHPWMSRLASPGKRTPDTHVIGDQLHTTAGLDTRAIEMSAVVSVM